ncbi:MAG: Na+/H+ dicarboxylate symporter [Myxococcales bacterium]|nr:Na+/H+ dicarboxylate symporter [Myxococcales bacterium]
MHAPEPRPRVPLLVQLVLALIAGGLVGAALGPRVAVLGELALVFVKLLKLLATPLVFVAIIDTFATTRLPPRRALVLLPISTINALVAAAIAIGLAHALPLGRFVDLVRLRQLVLQPAPPPPHAIALLLRGIEYLLIENLLWVIGAALLTGLLVRALGQRPSGKRMARLAHDGFALLMRALGVVVRLVPLAAFGVMAKVVGTSGLAIFPVLGVFVLLVTVGIALHVFAWYGLVLKLLARTSPARFFRLGGDALGTALGAGSSLATLPVTLRTLEERMGVSQESARLAAVVGTNLNHDGIVLYEAAAALFVAQLYGIALTVAAQVKVVGLAILAAVGIAGVPEAGLVTLALVLGRAGLPLAAVPLVLPVDWMLGRLRATANVASDMVVATLLDRWK